VVEETETPFLYKKVAISRSGRVAMMAGVAIGKPGRDMPLDRAVLVEL